MLMLYSICYSIVETFLNRIDNDLLIFLLTYILKEFALCIILRKLMLVEHIINILTVGGEFLPEVGGGQERNYHPQYLSFSRFFIWSISNRNQGSIFMPSRMLRHPMAN